MRIIGVALAILIVTLTVTGLAARRLVRPLRELTRAAERISGGELAARVTVTGDDEIGQLGAAFNTMAARREQLEQQRSAMVSDVAHELRTPVSNIRGWLEAAEDGLATPNGELVSSLIEEAMMLGHIIDDLQDLSAAEAGKLVDGRGSSSATSSKGSWRRTARAQLTPTSGSRSRHLGRSPPTSTRCACARS